VYNQPFYGPFSGTTQVSRCQKRSSSGLYDSREDNSGRHTDNPDGRHSICTNQRPTSIIPHFTPDALPATTLPICPGLGWNRHQICQLAFPVACLMQARTNWEGCDRKGIRRKNGGCGSGSLTSPDGVAPSRIVGVSASVIIPCTIKSKISFLLAPAHLGSPRKRDIKKAVCVF